ncbi:MAG TPA: metalloregulator ArsR/SmtB family transcription factor [Vicinamibacteria bacterium]|nr:metalloregulator ArsR/SmtB family transcription factor [Vicinamibacteria bacterium]
MAAKRGAYLASAPIFAALGDETRLRLVARLCSGGPQSIARLTAGTEVTRQAVTKHLLVLAEAGLVQVVRQGRESRWELEPDSLGVARRHLELISDEWTERLQALERHLDSEPERKSRATRRRRKSPASKSRVA